MTCAPRITRRNLRPAHGPRNRLPPGGGGSCSSTADQPSSVLPGLTVAVTGASGNAGTALLRRLSAPGSGVAAYAPGPVGYRVSEDWPTTGIPRSQYSRGKAETERVVRQVTAGQPELTVTVVRPTLIL